MLSCAALLSSATSIAATISSSPAAISFPTITTVTTRSIIRFDNRAFIKQSFPSSSVTDPTNKSSLHYDSLRLLEWGKLCDSVASFASTSLGRDATKAQLWSLNQTYEESTRLLDETNAAVEMQKHGGCSLNFSSVDVVLVKSAIQHARRGLPMDGIEAMAVVDLLLLAETMQSNLKAAIKEDSDWYKRFMPLTEVITELVVNRSVIKLIQKLIDEDGSVKDSASPNLKRSRDQVRMLERKLYQYMDSLIRNEMNETSSTEVTSIDGRWCIRSADELTSFQGLLLSSGSGVGTIVEPLSAVPLNDELQQARASVAKAETDVLSLLTEKMQLDLDDIEKLLNSVTRLDVINARATYSLSFGGTCPDLFLLKDESGSLTSEAHLSRIKTPKASHPTKRKWTLYLPKSYHPLLLQQHRQNLQKARKDVSQAKFEIRRKLQEGNMTRKGESDTDISTLQMQVTKLEQAHPVPVDFFISRKTRVLVITGPNTGGKTICLKTVGLAAMMAKSGLYVLSSESVQIPWFDSVFADIGDEQSLSQSLSTFSGHLKQISEIQSQSTSQSLVLLDEVGAGTNPLEGAALGMSVLEFFAETGASLTLATTHHGELKTLKYSNDAFENACMEFDEVNLKPTYKILWGVPGRSNAINIAERIGLPNIVVDNARELHGATSAEINEVIIDMERFKQDIQKHIYEAQHHLTLSRELREKLLVARREIMEHGSDQRYKKIGQISEAATIARSTLHKKVRQLRQSSTKATTAAIKTQQYTADNNSKHSTATKSVSPVQAVKPSLSGITNYISEEKGELLKVGDMVHISAIGKKGTILRVEPSKQEILVQAGNMKLKLKFSDVRKA